ncbi:PREDICTED: uncharacterized protein LOC109582328 [Amphimedon queenslandica]|uniref:Uncharacterized protein n=1 Tax=Amphimedon queenslandica TaxID=400682 RepID=A0AAN0J743_AMPQE|nr:PREDICTED: uncharacterized protein LOC109582328 [Amphimedon queenslandica]|eukprot:XP_019852556.1 PREDICTED: uncharacterized protein LOC109582328 [Amphimedon queenslandica]
MPVTNCSSSCINSPSICSTTTVLKFYDTTTTPYYYYTSLIYLPWQGKTTTVSTATPSVSVTPSISDSSDSVIVLGVSVGVLLILLTVSVIINICCYFIRMKSSLTTKQTKSDDDIAMQVCEPYELDKPELSEDNQVIYEEI